MALVKGMGAGGFPLDPASQGKGLRRSEGPCRSEPAHAAGTNDSDWAFTTRALSGGRDGSHLAKESRRELAKGLANPARRLKIGNEGAGGDG